MHSTTWFLRNFEELGALQLLVVSFAGTHISDEHVEEVPGTCGIIVLRTEGRLREKRRSIVRRVLDRIQC